MNSGWMKIHRSLLNKPIWTDSTPEQKVILMTFLMMANYEEKEWAWKGACFVYSLANLSLRFLLSSNDVGKGLVNRRWR